MKHKKLLITLLSVAVVAVGCKPSAEKSAAENREATAQQFDKVKTETKEAAHAMKDYAFAQKAEFVATMEKQLAELNRDLDQLAEKIEKSSASAKAEASIKLQEVREKVARLNESLDGVQSATESTWEEVKAGVKKGYEEVKDSFRQARQWLSEKIAP